MKRLTMVFVLAATISSLQAKEMAQPEQKDQSACDVILCRKELGDAGDLWAANKVDEAIAAYKKITSYNPAIAKAWVAIGTLNARKGNVVEAKIAYRTALACQPDYPVGSFHPLDPTSPSEKQVIRELVRLRPDLAGVTFFSELIFKKPKSGPSGSKAIIPYEGWQEDIMSQSAGGLLVQSLIAASNGEGAISLKKCRMAAEIQPWWIVPLGMLDTLSLAEDKDDPVLAEIYSPLKGSDARKLTDDLRKRMLSSMQHAGRIDVHQLAIKWPDSAIVRYDRAEPKIGGPPIKQAIEELKKLILARPLSPAPHKGLALCLYEMGKLNEASAELKNAILLEPLDWESMSKLAILFIQQGKTREAADELEKVLSQHPGCAEAHYFMGLIVDSLGKEYDPLPYLRAAVTLKPNDPQVRRALAGALWNKSFTEEALAHAKVASRLDPDDAETHCLIGAILEKLGEVKGARSSFEKCVKCPEKPGSHPSMDYARAALQRLKE